MLFFFFFFNPTPKPNSLKKGWIIHQGVFLSNAAKTYSSMLLLHVFLITGLRIHFRQSVSSGLTPVCDPFTNTVGISALLCAKVLGMHGLAVLLSFNNLHIYLPLCDKNEQKIQDSASLKPKKS